MNRFFYFRNSDIDIAQNELPVNILHWCHETKVHNDLLLIYVQP